MNVERCLEKVKHLGNPRCFLSTYSHQRDDLTNAVRQLIISSYEKRREILMIEGWEHLSTVCCLSARSYTTYDDFLNSFSEGESGKIKAYLFFYSSVGVSYIDYRHDRVEPYNPFVYAEYFRNTMKKHFLKKDDALQSAQNLVFNVWNH